MKGRPVRGADPGLPRRTADATPRPRGPGARPRSAPGQATARAATRGPGAALTVAETRAAFREVDAVAASLELFSTEYEGASDLPSVGERRRRGRAAEPDPVVTVSLVLTPEGVLLWQAGAPGSGLAGMRRRRGAPPAIDGEVVELYQYENLEPNEINRFLAGLDDRLNGATGIARLQLTTGTARVDRTPAARVAPTGKKRRLLLVHGTFGTTDGLVQGMTAAPNGARFFQRLFAHYDEVLAFDHPTLSVSPMLNGFDLSRLMTGASGPLDIVAHSRGGLVVRWFLEGFGAALGDGPYRAVLVGAPLGGTSLASPRRLRDALSVLSNLGAALRIGGAVAEVYLPLLVAPLALLRVATSVVSVAAKTPVVDAAVSMIPGLAGQSRVALNQELERVRAIALARPPTYLVVQSSFESEDPGWRFWRWFRADALRGAGAEAVFPAENDLVVDTRSMTEFSAASPAAAPAVPALPADRRYDFGASRTVHHTNYFEQEETLDFILDRLGIP